jgi:hypothetical protein
MLAFLRPCFSTPLQDIYKYVTHEKGLLGSQGDYNARHRRLCAPPFRNKQQLQRFADVVVQRWAGGRVHRGGPHSMGPDG